MTDEERMTDPFRGAFEDGRPRDPSHHWYKDKPMSRDRLASVLTDILLDKGITGHLVLVAGEASPPTCAPGTVPVYNSSSGNWLCIPHDYDPNHGHA